MNHLLSTASALMRTTRRTQCTTALRTDDELEFYQAILNMAAAPVGVTVEADSVKHNI